MECVVGPSAVRCGGVAIGVAVTLDRSGGKESLFVKSRKAYSKQNGHGVSVSAYAPLSRAVSEDFLLEVLGIGISLTISAELCRVGWR